MLAVRIRDRGLKLAEAVEVAGEAERLMNGREHLVDSGHVLRLAEAFGLSAYDCEFVALAEALSVPLVCADRQLVQALPSVATSPEAFGSGED